METGGQAGGGVCFQWSGLVDRSNAAKCPGTVEARRNLKILVILFLVFIVGSLLSALYFLVTDRGRSDRMARALTVRVVLSVVLFVLLMLGYYFGLITGKL